MCAACASSGPSPEADLTALIGGREFRAGRGPGTSPPEAVLQVSTGTLQLVGTDAGSAGQRTLSIVLGQYAGDGTYQVADLATGRHAMVITLVESAGSPGWTTSSHWSDSTHVGTVTLAENPEGTRVEGSFTLALTSVGFGVLQVTGGSLSLPVRRLSPH